MKTENKDPDHEARELVIQISKPFIYEHNYKWEDFLDICLFALEEREKEYMDLVKRIGKDQTKKYAKTYGMLMKFFYMDQKYWDILGECYMRIAHRAKRSDEAYTPFHICRAMTAIADPKPEDKTMDACLGSGAFILAVKEHLWKKYKHNSMQNLFGMDISNTAVKMAKIQNYLTTYNFIGLLLLKNVAVTRK